jgi:uncharacterized membrane protein YbhN (UPF0104 family)
MSRPASRPRDEASTAPRQDALEDTGQIVQARKRLPLWLLALKIGLVTVGLLLLLRWALQRLPADTVTPDARSLIGALLLNQLALYAAACRLQATLAAFGVHIRRGQAMRIHLQSLFYFFFVPMSVGLEIARFIKVRDIDPGVPAKRLLFALLLDRVLGLVAAVALVAALLPVVMPNALHQLWHPGWFSFLVAGTLLLVAVFWFHAPFRQRLVDAVAATAQVGRSLPLLIALSLAALLLVCASVYLIALGAKVDVGPAALTFALSASLLGMLLPVSLLGATLGEAAGAGLFALLGLNAAAALLLVSAAYGGRLIGAMQGGIIELWIDGNPLVVTGRASPGQRGDDGRDDSN